jgi:tetratricopeptide (TPR) repeat protein
MKAKRRHELEHNILAQWIATWLKRMEPYWTHVFLGLLAVAVVYAGWSFLSHYNRQGTSGVWDKFNLALFQDSLGELDGLADEHRGESVGHWAALVASEQRRITGSALMVRNRRLARDELRRAVEGYALVIDKSQAPDLLQMALFGRARCYETLAGAGPGEGDLDKAIADYRRLAEIAPEGPYAAEAKRRAELLDTKKVREFYDKYAAHEPKPPVSPSDFPSVPELPFDASSLPDSLRDSGISNILNLGDLKSMKKTEKPAKKDTPKPDTPKTEPGRSESPKSEAGKGVPGKTEPSKK